jgi:hypothetical protein
MYGIVLDTTDIFVCCSIIDVLVNVIVDVSVREAVSKIIVRSLVDFLVATVAWFVGTVLIASILTTIVSMNFSIVVVVLWSEDIR